MNTVKIVSRWDSTKVLFECEAPEGLESGLHMRFALEKATEARASLAGAYLADANLAGAYLAGAYLADANLADANLARAYLADANLARAYLAGANLAGASLARANLAGASLAGANLAGASLAGAKGSDVAIAMTRILPEGSLIGWKKCMNGVIVKLRIPEEAKRSHAFGRKCRAEYVDVLAIEERDGDGWKAAEVATSSHDERTEYRVGQRVIPDAFDDNWMDECSNGIHFFINRLEAERY